jgi:predicted ATP-dependent serine protease
MPKGFAAKLEKYATATQLPFEIKRESRMDMMSTGIPGIDHLLGGGFRLGSLNVIMGAPGSGKTACATSITRRMPLSLVREETRHVIYMGYDLYLFSEREIPAEDVDAY